MSFWPRPKRSSEHSGRGSRWRARRRASARTPRTAPCSPRASCTARAGSPRASSHAAPSSRWPDRAGRRRRSGARRDDAPTTPLSRDAQPSSRSRSTSVSHGDASHVDCPLAARMSRQRSSRTAEEAAARLSCAVEVVAVVEAAWGEVSGLPARSRAQPAARARRRHPRFTSQRRDLDEELACEARPIETCKTSSSPRTQPLAQPRTPRIAQRDNRAQTEVLKTGANYLFGALDSRTTRQRHPRRRTQPWTRRLTPHQAPITGRRRLRPPKTCSLSRGTPPLRPRPARAAAPSGR